MDTENQESLNPAELGNKFKTDVSISYDPILKLIKKYHNIGMELSKRKKVTTDVIDISVINLQILTNERFITDLTSLL